MRLLIFTIWSVLLFQQAMSAEELQHECEDAKDSLFLLFFFQLSNKQSSTDIHFYLGVKNDNSSLKIGDGDWSALKSEHFNPSQKTVIIIHGYRSNYQKNWILDLKDTLFEHRKINLIMVDWRKGSNKWNYINSYLSAKQLKFDIMKFLNKLRIAVKKSHGSDDGEWKNLYFIGHSLGAHISGQTAHLIRSSKNPFYKVERITGLDPAQPCFTKADDTLKLDKTDADFVDVIHTQTGVGEGINGFGIKDNIGHIDFYVDGGVQQAECLQTKWTLEINRMICSHKIACRYFIESIESAESTCEFVGYKWDRSYDDALRILKDAENGDSCTNCPKMGIESTKSSGSGSYLVITPDKQPHCSKYEKTGLEILQKAIDRLQIKKSEWENATDYDIMFSNFD